MDAPGISGAVGVRGKHIRTLRRRSFKSATVHYQNERGILMSDAVTVTLIICVTITVLVLAFLGAAVYVNKRKGK